MNYGNATCEKCGENRVDVLDLDHINGGGSGDRRSMSGYALALRLKNQGYPKGFRVLCRNCNWLAYLRRKRRDDPSFGR